MSARAPAADTAAPAESRSVVSFVVAGQRLGIDIARVEDVFVVNEITPVPLAPGGVAGILNLRGKVVTAVCLRRILGFSGERGPGRRLAVGVSRGNEIYGFLIDNVGDVVSIDPSDREPVPAHLRDRWSRFACAIHKTGDGLLVELDAEKLTRLDVDAIAA